MSTYVKRSLFRDLVEKGKVITNKDPLNKTNRKGEGEIFSDDGLYSSIIFGDENDPESLEQLGWIDFEGNYLINPLYYDRLVRLFQKSRLEELISFDRNITAEGRVLSTEEMAELNKARRTRGTKPLEDSNLGLITFRERFLELLQKYVPKSKREADGGRTYHSVIEAYLNGYLFIDAYPVISSRLRPANFNRSSKTFRFTEINNSYNLLIAQVELLKDLQIHDRHEDSGQKLQILGLYENMQKYLNEIFETIVNDYLKDKKGAYRKMVAAARVNFSARNLISPDPENRINEITMNYQTFAILYEPLLINLVNRYKKIGFVQSREWVRSRQYIFDDELFGYMNDLLNNSKNGLWLLLNRNPSISINSIHRIRIRKIKEDINDVVLGISNQIIGGMGELQCPYKIAK